MIRHGSSTLPRLGHGGRLQRAVGFPADSQRGRQGDTRHEDPANDPLSSSVARDRGWFSRYTPFPTFVVDMHNVSNPQRQALGIGDVHLPVQLIPGRINGFYPEAHGTLHLRDVLHVPSSYCNIIGSSDIGDYSKMVYRDGAWGEITAVDGRPLGYFVKRNLWVLKLSEPPFGPAVGPSVARMIFIVNATWPDSERERWIRTGYPGWS